MPLSPDHARQLPLWKARKDAQWDRIAGTMPGLQLVTTREGGNQYMLVCHRPADEERGVPEFYEGVVIGQLPLVVIERTRLPGGRTGRKAMAEHKKPIHKRGIDLSDEEIDQVLACWRVGRSALSLPFIAQVQGRDGKMVGR
jgi:hypothetical protein